MSAFSLVASNTAGRRRSTALGPQDSILYYDFNDAINGIINQGSAGTAMNMTAISGNTTSGSTVAGTKVGAGTLRNYTTSSGLKNDTGTFSIGNSWSICFWYTSVTPQGNQIYPSIFFSMSNNAGSNFGIQANNDGFMVMINQSNPGNPMTSYQPSTWLTFTPNGSATNSMNLFSGSWVHIAITCNAGGTVTIYKNGTSFGTAASCAFNGGTMNRTYIGTSGGGSTNKYQYLDDMRIYGRALSAGEVTTIYNNTK